MGGWIWALPVQTPKSSAVMIDRVGNSVKRSYQMEVRSGMSSLLRDSKPLELRRAEPIGEDEAHRLVQDERLRLARELHDIVSFGFATIAMQAGVAAHVADSQPEQAFEALQAIRVASRDVLHDVRAVLGQLRDDDAAGSDPARGIGQLSSLAESTSGAGVRTSVLILGQPRPVPLAVDLSVYRIVQEALANVLRHAPGATACVRLVYERSYLVVSIEDDGAAEASGGTSAAEGSGYGIVGMRERAHALGGDLDAGPLLGRGYCVRATLPFLARP
jgi:signal transduction histidine kinase